jgi:polar amino acid transport system ATP-binding protein
MRLELTGITKRYGAQFALREAALEIPEEARTICFIGPSGGGKSTLLRILGGLETPDAGEVRIEGAAMDFSPDALLAHRRKNGFLFQSFNLFPHLSAHENVALPLREVHAMTKGKARESADEALARFGLAEHAHKMPAQMSGGQQQRVGLARAMAHAPRLLILDEPTSALDPEMTAEVLEVIEGLRDAGQEIILSTHEMGFARAVADRVVFLAEGHVVASGPPAEIFEGEDCELLRRFLSRVMRY